MLGLAKKGFLLTLGATVLAMETMEKVASVQAKTVKEKIATCEITQGSGVEKGMSVTFLQ